MDIQNDDVVQTWLTIPDLRPISFEPQGTQFHFIPKVPYEVYDLTKEEWIQFETAISVDVHLQEQLHHKLIQKYVVYVVIIMIICNYIGSVLLFTDHPI